MGIFRVITRGKIYNQVCENVLHFAADGHQEESAVIARVRDVWLPTVRNIQNANFTWFQIACQNIEPPAGPLVIENFPLQAGSLSGPGAHPSLAALFSLRAGCAGRHCRGRIYIPGVHGESVDQGQVQSGALVAYNSMATLMLDRFGHNGTQTSVVELVILPRAQPTNYKSVTQIIARGQFGIQRRRNIGVGS